MSKKNLITYLDVHKTRIRFFHAETPKFAEKLVRILMNKGGPVLGCDIETARAAGFENDPKAGLCPYRSKISLIQFYDEATHACYSVDLFTVPIDIIAPVLRGKRLVFHNAIFDQQHLAHNGYKNLKVDCTMIMYQLWRIAKYGNVEDEMVAAMEKHPHEDFGEEGDGSALDWMTQKDRFGAGLSGITAKLFGVRVPKTLQTSDWGKRPLDREQLNYAAADPYFTYIIAKKLSPDMKELGLNAVYKLDRQVIHPVVEMILNGSKLNEELHREHCKVWETRYDELQAWLFKRFDTKINNIRSLLQLSKWFDKHLPLELQQHWPRSEKTGLLKMDAKTLSKYRNFDYVENLLEYKKLDKMLGTYGIPLLNRICPVTGRLHGSFTIGYTATNRLSSRDPNLQNLPRDESIREIFIVEPGRKLVGADYSQVELRVLAMLSGDKRMLKAFDNGIDVHKYLVSKVLGKKLKDVTKEDRQLGKSLNFGLSYGLGVNGLLEYAAWNYGVVLSREEAQQYYNRFFEMWGDYAVWCIKRREEAEKYEFTTTVLGKRRFLHSDKGYTRSVNHPVQGSAAEIVLKALVRIYKKVDGTNIKMVNCVHDEILLDVSIHEVERASKLLKRCMNSAMLDIFPEANLSNLIEVKVGDTWAALK